MDAIGYVRVSTREQAEHGLGLDVQESTVRAYCSAHRLKLTRIVREQASGASYDRDGLAEVLSCAGNGSAVVVARLDRLARDLVVQELVLRELVGKGSRLLSCVDAETESLDDGDPTRRMIRQILGAVADYERALVRMRLAAGRQRKAEQGGYAFGGPPYGYSARNGSLVPNEREQGVIERMLALRAEGQSLRAICATLDREGSKPRRGAKWQPNVVNTILWRHGNGSKEG